MDVTKVRATIKAAMAVRTPSMRELFNTCARKREGSVRAWRGNVQYQLQHYVEMIRGARMPPTCVAFTFKNMVTPDAAGMPRFSLALVFEAGQEVYELLGVYVAVGSCYMCIGARGGEWEAQAVSRGGRTEAHVVGGCSHFLDAFREHRGVTEVHVAVMRAVYACFLCEAFPEKVADMKRCFPDTFESIV